MASLEIVGEVITPSIVGAGKLRKKFKRFGRVMFDPTHLAAAIRSRVSGDLTEADYLILEAMNGQKGVIDLSSGTLYMAGQVIDQEPLTEDVFVVGRIGDRIKKVAKKIIKAKPLRKLASTFAKVAKSPVFQTIARAVPPPIGTAMRGATAAANIVANVRAGSRQAANQVRALASASRGGSAQATAALNLVRQVYQQGEG